MHAVVFEQMGVGRDRAEVVDRDHLDILALGFMRRAQGHPAGPAKAVDRNSYCHGSFLQLELPWQFRSAGSPVH